MPLCMMHHMPKKEWITEPCRRCGKTPRYDYDGYCMDCAEDLALRGLVAPPSGQSAGGAAAELDRERTAENEVPYPRVCKKAGELSSLLHFPLVAFQPRIPPLEGLPEFIVEYARAHL